MNGTLARMLGRPDLSGVPVDMYGGTSGHFQAGVSSSGAAVGATADGRVTAGVLIVMLVGVVAFYAWTRNIQH